jgi:hypothetical protein
MEAEEMVYSREDEAVLVGQDADNAHNARIERALKETFSHFMEKPKISLPW